MFILLRVSIERVQVKHCQQRGYISWSTIFWVLISTHIPCFLSFLNCGGFLSRVICWCPVPSQDWLCLVQGWLTLLQLLYDARAFRWLVMPFELLTTRIPRLTNCIDINIDGKFYPRGTLQPMSIHCKNHFIIENHKTVSSLCQPSWLTGNSLRAARTP